MEGSYILSIDANDFTAHLRKIEVRAHPSWAVEGCEGCAEDLAHEAAVLLKHILPDYPHKVTVGPGRGKVTAGTVAYAALRMAEADGDNRNGVLYCAELGFDGVPREARGAVAAELLAEAHGLRLEGVVWRRSEGEAGERPVSPDPFPVEPDLAEVASSGRNILLAGRPGSGKTMRARRIGRPGMPDNTVWTRVVEVYSCTGLATPRSRPFRAPHHTMSARGLKSEAHLATGGVLFLDEVNEFSRRSIETLVDLLRQMPDEFRPQVVMAANSCACGWHGTSRRCACGAETLTRYEEWIRYVADLFGAVVFNDVAEHFHPARFERKDPRTEI